jgi:hypothetical protein
MKATIMINVALRMDALISLDALKMIFRLGNVPANPVYYCS